MRSIKRTHFLNKWFIKGCRPLSFTQWLDLNFLSSECLQIIFGHKWASEFTTLAKDGLTQAWKAAIDKKQDLAASASLWLTIPQSMSSNIQTRLVRESISSIISPLKGRLTDNLSIIYWRIYYLEKVLEWCSSCTFCNPALQAYQTT